MRVVSILIFWTGLFLILIFVALPIFIHLTSLEFTNDHYNSNFEQTRFYALPIAILLTLFGTIKKGDITEKIIGKIGLTLLASIVTFIVLFFSAFTTMCTWTDRRVLFVRVNDPKTKIVLRDYGCGATDSGIPVYKTFKVKNLTRFLVSITSIDTTSIDKRQWVQIGNKE